MPVLITGRIDFPQNPRLLLAAIANEIIAGSFSSQPVTLSTGQPIAMRPTSADAAFSALPSFTPHMFKVSGHTPGQGWWRSVAWQPALRAGCQCRLSTNRGGANAFPCSKQPMWAHCMEKKAEVDRPTHRSLDISQTKSGQPTPAS